MMSVLARHSLIGTGRLARRKRFLLHLDEQVMRKFLKRRFGVDSARNVL